MKAKFQGTLVNVHVDKIRVPNRIHLTDVEDGMPYAVATIDIPDLDGMEGYVGIKDYSENEGMLEFLIKNKIVEPPVAYLKSGFVEIPICKIN